MEGNPHELAARWTKAHKLAQVARQLGETPADVAGWQDWQWEAARLLAGVKPPSDPAEAHRHVSVATRSAVLHFLTDAVPVDDPYHTV